MPVITLARVIVAELKIRKLLVVSHLDRFIALGVMGKVRYGRRLGPSLNEFIAGSYISFPGFGTLLKGTSAVL